MDFNIGIALTNQLNIEEIYSLLNKLLEKIDDLSDEVIDLQTKVESDNSKQNITNYGNITINNF